MYFHTYRSRVLVYGGALFFFLIIFQVFSYRTAHDSVTIEAEQSLQRTVQLFKERLLAEKIEMERFAAVLRDDVRLQEYVFVAVEFDSGQDALQTQYLKQFGWLPIDKVLFISEQGAVILGHKQDSLLKFLDGKYLASAVRSFYIETDKGLELIATAPLEHKGRFLGSIVISRTLDDKWLEEMTRNNIGELIVEKDGIVQYSTILGYRSKQHLSKDGKITYGNGVYRIFPITLTGLEGTATKLWFGASVTDMVARLAQHRNDAFLQFLIGCTVIVAFGWLISRNFDKPLAQLASLTREIALGHLPKVEKAQAKTEIGVLRNQFVDMVQALREKDAQVSQIHDELEKSAVTDALTGLNNRRAFEATLAKVVENAKLGNREHALCFLDLDQFKVVNDSCGHEAGDELLRQLTKLLLTRVRGTDMLARLGGDEFGLILSNVDEEVARSIGAEIVQLVKDYKFLWDERIFGIGVSIGLVMLNKTSDSVTDVMRHADIACYAAKNQGRNRLQVYRSHEQDSVQMVEEINWVQILRDALENDRFQLWYQPIVATSEDTDIDRGEILLRLVKPNGEIVLPGIFVSAAERYHLMPEIDKWVFEHTMRYIQQRRQSGGTFMFSVNISGMSMNDSKMLDYFESKLQAAGLPEGMLCFEITETTAIHNLPNALAFVNTLKKLGCRFSLDDFGAGLSTFNLFRNLPVDYIKIDGSFIVNIVDNNVDEGMVAAINRLAQLMNKETIAEYVENDAIKVRVTELGVNYLQGFAIGKPVPMESYFSGMGVQPTLATDAGGVQDQKAG